MQDECRSSGRKDRAGCSPSRKYFTLTDVTYEQTTAKPKKGKTEPTPKLNGGGSSSGDDGL